MNLNRWVIYQKERFPLAHYGAIVAAFAYSGLCVSRMMRGESGLPDFQAFIAAYLSALILFFQLRVADEFKDHDEDLKYQPTRPVPRGLIKLPELAAVGLIGAIVQIALSVSYHQSLIFPLALTWLYFALMSVEFFVGDWLRAHPFTYLWSHMLILLFVDLFITAFDWMKSSTMPPHGLWLFLAVSFLNGVIIEVGRKIKSPAEEKVGVATYTSSWGQTTAIAVWLMAIISSGFFAVTTAVQLGFGMPVMVMAASLGLVAFTLALKFIKSPKTGKHFESFSGAWTLATYLALGTIPLLIKTI
ncbi:MAG: hypothetical protein IAF58_12200 [Leptolyngbya sp.]|nr:hypothetical protein [Candidatus Melainabacteria bacterium]